MILWNEPWANRQGKRHPPPYRAAAGQIVRCEEDKAGCLYAGDFLFALPPDDAKPYEVEGYSFRRECFRYERSGHECTAAWVRFDELPTSNPRKADKGYFVVDSRGIQSFARAYQDTPDVLFSSVWVFSGGEPIYGPAWRPAIRDAP